MNIRKATTADAYSIAAVHIASWRSAYKGIMPDGILDSLDMDRKTEAWREILSSSDWPAYVSCAANRVTGFIHISDYRDCDLGSQRVGEITAIYIDPAVLGRGIGAQLLSKGIEHLQDRGRSKIALWVLEKNSRAISFYHKFGFLPDQGRKIHPKTGLVELRYVR